MQQLPSFLQGVYPKSFDTSAEQNKSLFSQELVQSEIKSFNENTVPKQEQVETPKLTTDDFFGDTQKVMDSLGITKEEAIKNTLNFYKTKGLEVEGIDIEAELEQRSQPKIDTSSFLGKLESAGQDRIQREGESTLESIQTGGENLVGGAVSNIPSIIGNTFGFLADVITPKEMEGLGDFFREQGIKDKEGLQEVLGVDPDAFLTQAGEFGSELGTLFTPTGAAGGAAKLGEKAPLLVQGLKNIGKVTEKAPAVLKALGSSAVKGATEVGKLEVISEGEITPEGLAVGAVANPVIGTTMKGIGKITKPVAEKLEVMGLLNPAKLKIVSDQLKTEGVDNISVSEHLLKNNIKGSKEKIVQQLDDLANASKSEVDTAINSIPGNFKQESVDGILSQIRKDFSDVPGQESVINRAKELFVKSTKGEGLSLKEIQEVKRMADQHLNLFTVVGDPRAGAVKQGLVNLRGKVQKFIETTAEKNGISNIKQLNKNTQVNRTLIDAIERKDSADQARELLSAFAPTGVLAGVGGIGAISQGQDPFNILKAIIIGGAAGKVAGSTSVKTGVANILNKLTPTERNGIIDFMDSDGLKPINTALVEKIKGLISNEE